jgi:hypothetical protein
MDSAPHVNGCRLTHVTRVLHAFDDVASTIHQSLYYGAKNYQKNHTLCYIIFCFINTACRIGLFVVADSTTAQVLVGRCRFTPG